MAFVIDPGSFETGTEDFDLCVVEKSLGPARVRPAGRVGPGDHPLHKLTLQAIAKGWGAAGGASHRGATASC